MKREEALKILRKDLLSNLVDYYSSEELQDAIDTVVSQPSLPSNLDEAAEDSWAVYEYRESPRGLYSTCYVDGFKAGAEWMAGQGIKLHGRILPGPRCNLYIESDCFDRGYKGLNYRFSDSNDVDMFVQIRKK